MAISMKKLPPVVDTYQTAFVITDGAKIYFSPSVLYKTGTPRRIHYTLKKQNNNENAFEPTLVNCGIDILDYDGQYYGYDASKELYYIYIPNFLVGGDGFLINTYYKIQIRFDDCTDSFDDKPNYLLDNVDSFTEWSTITLVKPISIPRITFSALGNSLGTFPIVGKLKFSDTAETEKLESYSIVVYNTKDSTKPLYESGLLYPGNINNPNEINHTFFLKQPNDTKIIIYIDYKTNNGYEGRKTTIRDIEGQYELTGNITTNVNNDNGKVIIHIDSFINTANIGRQSQDWSNSVLYVRRASSLDNYTNWEMFYTENIGTLNGDYSKELTDLTVQSLTGYKYSIQLYNKEGFGTSKLHYSEIIKSSEIIPNFDTCFIYDGELQLALRYDYKLSSIKPTANITKLDTLGGKYPKFAENAVTKYRQFSISATITAESDFNELFYVLDDEDEEDTTYYNRYKEANDIIELVRNEAESNQVLDKPYEGNEITTKYPHMDPLLEREFKDKVCKWINTSTPKLMRSINEGNIMVVFMDPSFSPIGNLGNRLYTLSMTAYEVGEGTSIKDLKSFDIIDTNEEESKPEPAPQPSINPTNGPFIETLDSSDNNQLNPNDTVKYFNNLTIKAEAPDTKVYIQQCTKGGVKIGDKLVITLTNYDDSGKYLYVTGPGIFIKDVYIDKTNTDSNKIEITVSGVKSTENSQSSNQSTTNTNSAIKTNEYKEVGQCVININRSLKDNIVGNSRWEQDGYIYERKINHYYGTSITGAPTTKITISYQHNEDDESVNIATEIPTSGMLNLSFADIVNNAGYAELEEYDCGIINIAVSANDSSTSNDDSSTTNDDSSTTNQDLIVNYLANVVETKQKKEESAGDTNAS